MMLLKHFGLPPIYAIKMLKALFVILSKKKFEVLLSVDEHISGLKNFVESLFLEHWSSAYSKMTELILAIPEASVQNAIFVTFSKSACKYSSTNIHAYIFSSARDTFLHERSL